MNTATAPRDIADDGGNDVLQAIVGVRLTSVQFVLNYLILGFDQKGALTTLVWPILVGPDRELRYGDGGYRDRLCELIERIVKRVEVSSEETIAISFDDGSEIHMPLRTYAARGERAIFSGAKHILCAW